MADTATHCPYCALQCAMTVTTPEPTASSARAPQAAGREFPTNRGGLCRKGWTATDLLAHPDRVTAPLLRGDDGRHRPISWDQALELIRDQVLASRSRYGADSIGVFGGGGLTNEKAYQLGKFARIALGTSRIDYNGRFCMSSAAAAGNRAFGLDRGLTFPLEDLGRARTVLMLGSNVADTMPPFVQHLANTREHGGLIVVDPRRSATAALTANGSGIHLQPTPGSDLVLLLGLAHIIIADGLADREFLNTRTAGFDAVARSVVPWWPERVQSVTGVPAAQLRDVAHRLAGSSPQAPASGSPQAGPEGSPNAATNPPASAGTYILTGRGVEQHIDGTDTVTAAINLALLLGLPGSADGGYGTLTGQGNGQGGREHGQKADQLPGYRRITDPVAREHVAKVWGVPAQSIPGPGLPAVELLASLGRPGGVRCLLVHGANVAVSAPDASSVIDGLRRLDFLVVSDFFLSETAAEAHLVLPVLQWAEEEGTMTNLEGRVLRRRRATAPPPGARSELWIMARLAELLAAPSTFSEDPETVFTELRAASAGGPADYSGIDYGLLDRGEAAYWPYPAGSTGTPRLFLDRFAHPGGRAVLTPVEPRLPAPGLHSGASLALVTGRLLEHYQSGTQTRRVADLASAQPGQRLHLHPVTAGARGIDQGAVVDVGNGRGTVRATALVTDQIRPDTVFLSFHFPGRASANLLTEAVTDPISGMPEFKTTGVWVRPAREAVQPHSPLAPAAGVLR